MAPKIPEGFLVIFEVFENGYFYHFGKMAIFGIYFYVFFTLKFSKNGQFYRPSKNGDF